jgi:hypothetical protein
MCSIWRQSIWRQQSRRYVQWKLGVYSLVNS